MCNDNFLIAQRSHVSFLTCINFVLVIILCKNNVVMFRLSDY